MMKIPTKKGDQRLSGKTSELDFDCERLSFQIFAVTYFI